jgi:hypothetical protein
MILQYLQRESLECEEKYLEKEKIGFDGFA